MAHCVVTFTYKITCDCIENCDSLREKNASRPNKTIFKWLQVSFRVYGCWVAASANQKSNKTRFSKIKVKQTSIRWLCHRPIKSISLSTNSEPHIAWSSLVGNKTESMQIYFGFFIKGKHAIIHLNSNLNTRIVSGCVPVCFIYNKNIRTKTVWRRGRYWYCDFTICSKIVILDQNLLRPL